MTTMFGASSGAGTQELVLTVPEPATAALLLAALALLAAGLHHKSGQRLPWQGASERGRSRHLPAPDCVRTVKAEAGSLSRRW